MTSNLNRNCTDLNKERSSSESVLIKTNKMALKENLEKISKSKKCRIFKDLVQSFLKRFVIYKNEL